MTLDEPVDEGEGVVVGIDRVDGSLANLWKRSSMGIYFALIGFVCYGLTELSLKGWLGESEVLGGFS